jgi:hypothetical protein
MHIGDQNLDKGQSHQVHADVQTIVDSRGAGGLDATGVDDHKP